MREMKGVVIERRSEIKSIEKVIKEIESNKKRIILGGKVSVNKYDGRKSN